MQLVGTLLLHWPDASLKPSSGTNTCCLRGNHIRVKQFPTVWNCFSVITEIGVSVDDMYLTVSRFHSAHGTIIFTFIEYSFHLTFKLPFSSLG